MRLFRRLANNKNLNIDSFGRWKGGVPTKKGWIIRKNSLGVVGEYADYRDIEDQFDPEYQTVN